MTLQPTPNSVAQMMGLAEGKFDNALTAFDNIVADVEGEGEAPAINLSSSRSWAATAGFLCLVVVPDVKRFADLKGKTLSVDARTSGYAFVLFEVLRRNGMAESNC